MFSTFFCDHSNEIYSIPFAGRTIEYRLPIFNYVAKDAELRKYELTQTEWDALKLVTAWLKTFRSATTQMSTTKQPMLSHTHTIFRGLQAKVKEAIEELPANADPALRDGLAQAHRKLSNYFTKFDVSRYCLWAGRSSFISFGSLTDPLFSS
jgi:hypothetical protein